MPRAKIRLFLLAFGLSILRATAAYLPVSTDANGFFHSNSGQSTYVGYKPGSYSEATPMTLLVWLHGCGGNAEGDLWAVAPAATRQAQSYIAISIGGRDGGCWAVNSDAPKVLAAITNVSQYFNINPRKVFLSGYSSGGDLAYRVGLQRASMFAGLLVENSSPFSDSGLTAASAQASASWKIHVAHLAHVSDTTYPITTVRSELAALVANNFPVTKIERPGTHYDADNGNFGTTYDLITYLLPLIDAGWETPRPAVSLVRGSTQAVQLTVTSPADAICIVSATTDLFPPVWIPVATNRVPFTYSEANGGLKQQRFYRAALVP